MVAQPTWSKQMSGSPELLCKDTVGPPSSYQSILSTWSGDAHTLYASVIYNRNLRGPFQPLSPSQFGKAIRCQLLRNDAWIDVVVKAPLSQRIDKNLLNEWLSLSKLPPHRNVIKLLGVCHNFNYLDEMKKEFIDSQVCFVTPFMAHGSIEDYFSKPENQGKGMSMKYLVKWALDIARGLAHLHQHKVVHRDIAARNILIDEDMNAVIADLGLLRREEDAKGKTYYRQIGSGYFNLNVAPEAVQDGLFSAASDIFAFALALFEIAMESKAEDPTIGLTTDQVYEHFRQSRRKDTRSCSISYPVHSHNCC